MLSFAAKQVIKTERPSWPGETQLATLKAPCK